MTIICLNCLAESKQSICENCATLARCKKCNGLLPCRSCESWRRLEDALLATLVARQPRRFITGKIQLLTPYNWLGPQLHWKLEAYEDSKPVSKIVAKQGGFWDPEGD